MGYLAWIDACDLFVFFDTVAFSRKSWHHRNRIRGVDGQIVWLTIPVHAHQQTPLCAARVAAEHGWQRKHWRTIRAAYQHAPYWDRVEQLEGWYATKYLHLAAATGALTQTLCTALGITTPLVFASDLGAQRPGRLARIADILDLTNATSLVDTEGARPVLGVDEIAGRPIRYLDYDHPRYEQNDYPWMSHLGAVDVLAWHGPDALEIIRSGA